MDSVGFDGGDESHPSTRKSKKYKLPRKRLDACGAVNNASVPRKLRSAIKKQDRGSITPSLPNARKQNHVTNGVELLRKHRLKKFKLNMKQGHITKDEKEVAETLYALADLFSDATKTSKPGLEGEQSKENSFTTPEGGSGTPVAEGSRKNSAGITLEIACLPFSNQSATATSSCIQSELSLYPRSKMSALDGIPCDELATGLEKVMDLEMQNGKNCNAMADKNNDLFLWPSSCSPGAPSFETQGSCLRHPPLFENTNYATQPRISKNTVTSDKHPQVGVESKKSWKRCSAHVYISRLIKIIQVSEKIDGILEKSSQATRNGGVKLRPHLYINNQKKGITAEKNLAEMQNALTLNKRLLQDQQQGSESSGLCSSLEQNSGFLSLAAGGCDLDANDCINRTGQDHKQPKKFHASCLQLHNHLPMLFPLPHNGYSSTFHGHAASALATQQVQLPPYPSSTLGNGAAAYTGQQVESHQQKGMAQLPSQYNRGGSVIPCIPNWQKGGIGTPSLLNHAPLFPHLDALPHLYEPIIPPAQQQLHISNVKMDYHRLRLQYERNGAASTYHPDNVQQLHLLLQPAFLKNG